jgi:hypothetical protein
MRTFVLVDGCEVKRSPVTNREMEEGEGCY